MSEPIRILQVFASLDRGGAEAMIMNLYRKIDKEKIQFDFVVNDRDTEYAHEKEITDLGGRIFRVPRFKLFNYSTYKKAWINLFENHPEWEIVHGHHTSPAFIYLSVAKRKKRLTIAHSHIAGTEKNIKSYSKKLMRLPLRYISDYLFACSDKASKWMFGNRSKKAHLINNSIDSAVFSYDECIRNKARKNLGIEDRFVIGHIGRFQTQKNHNFLIDVFYEVRKKNSHAVLLLIGDGDLRSSIKKKVESQGLEGSVLFLGVRSDIPELLLAMDMFLFPSLYEGLPVTLMEAQASGLKILASDTITNEVAITDNVEFMSLNSSAEVWADRIMKYSNGYERKDTSQEIVSAGYDIKSTAKWYENFMLKL